MNTRQVMQAAADKFRFYEREHMEKALVHGKNAVEYENISNSGSSPRSREFRGLEASSLGKAATNREMAGLLEAELAKPLSGFERAATFHEAFNLPVSGPGYEPTVEERLLRGRLMLEEVLEHLLAGLGLTLVWQDDEDPENEMFVNADDLASGAVKLLLEHDGVTPYSPVETLDGLCDVKVIANGTGVAFGLPVEAADAMIFESNMSKLGPDGQPIINGVTVGYRADASLSGHEQAEIAEDGFRPDLPMGKVLKPASFVAPDIGSLFE